MSEQTNFFCEAERAGSQDACMIVAGPIALIKTGTELASGQAAEGLSQAEDPLGLGRAQATMAMRFMSSMMGESGRPVVEEIADGAVPPERRCPTCPIRLVCQPPELPDVPPV